MRRYAGVLVMMGVLGSSTVLAQEQPHSMPPPPPAQGPERFEGRPGPVDPEQRQQEMAFRNEMQKIHLEKARLELERERRMLEPRDRQHGEKMGEAHGMLVVLCGIVHVLLAIWVYRDLRKRNEGAGLWVAITLLSGFFGALIYAVVRLGDAKQAG